MTPDGTGKFKGMQVPYDLPLGMRSERLARVVREVLEADASESHRLPSWVVLRLDDALRQFER